MRIVVKVGTSTLTHQSGCINIRHMEELVKVLSDLRNAGHELILVTSGAVGMGMGKLNLKSRPVDLTTKQAVSSVGQCELMYTYDRLFMQYNHTVAQILLTRDEIDMIDRQVCFEETIGKLLDFGVIPIINENDAISNDELKIGDNDTLSAIVACSVEAELLILMSDIEGLYTADPHKDPNAKLIAKVDEVNDEIMALGGGSGSNLGTGGMQTKLRAAKMVTEAGCDMVIMNGSKADLLYDVMEDKAVGTRFLGKKTGRK